MKVLYPVTATIEEADLTIPGPIAPAPATPLPLND